MLSPILDPSIESDEMEDLNIGCSARTDVRVRETCCKGGIGARRHNSSERLNVKLSSISDVGEREEIFFRSESGSLLAYRPSTATCLNR